MDNTLSEKELEQLTKLEQFGRLLKMILGGHIRLLIAIFAVALVVILGITYLKAALAPDRYEAQALLYYNPRETSNISADKSNYVLQVLTRSDLRSQFLAESAGIISSGRSKLPPQLSVTAVERNRRVDRFNVRVRSRDRKAAIALTNLFAERCIRAYIEDRSENLQKKRALLLEKRNEIVLELQEFGREKNAMDAPLSDAALRKEHDLLHHTIEELKPIHAELDLSVRDLETRRKDIKDSLVKLIPELAADEKPLRELIANEKTLRELTAKLKRLQQDIEQASNLYTEHNPKLKALVSHRQELHASLRRYLGGKANVGEEDYSRFDEIVGLVSALKTVQKDLDTRRGAARKVDQKFKAASDRYEHLCKIMPQLQEINRQCAILEDSLKKLDASVSDIDSLVPLIKDDMRLGEPSSSAYGASPLSAKKLFICIFSAISLTLLIVSLVALSEMWFGNVTGENELKIFTDLGYLGKLPNSEGMFESKHQEETAFNAICHSFQASEMEHHVVLAGALPGGKLIHSLFESFEWAYAMAGKRTLAIDMVSADDFDYEANPAADTGIVAYSGGKGFLPVASSHYLSPAELMLLKQDLGILRKSYDLIFIRHFVSLRKDRLFLEQILDLCDGAIFAVGANRTPRKCLRRLIAFHRQTHLPVMTILSESSNKHSALDTNLEVGV